MKYFKTGTRPAGKEEKRAAAALDVILIALSFILVLLSIRYAKERIIFSDTAVYMFELVRTKTFVVPTNRFVSILSQLLPLAGLRLGLPLSGLIVLYSLNFILIPVLSAMLLRFLFKQTYGALAVLLLYILMGSNLFYYPISEFQMGLCLLLVYQGLLLAFKAHRIPAVLYYLSGALLLVFITFSHPMCLPVFLAWLVWVVLTEAPVKAKDLVFPICLVLGSYYVKEHYFKAMIGNKDFDSSRAEGLQNFGGTMASYFNNNLAHSSLRSIWGDHFIAVFFLLFSLLYLLLQKKWRIAAVLAGICFGFWLLISVSFQNNGYDHYYEHLYQPLPFFISLAFTGYGIKLFRKEYLRISVLTVALLFAVAKVNGAHAYNARRQAWYQSCFRSMDELRLRKAALKIIYVPGANKDSYWSAPSESLLLSALNDADSSKTLFVVWNYRVAEKDINQTGDMALATSFSVPISSLDPIYFRLDTCKPYAILDSVVAQRVLDDLATAP